MRSQVGMVGGGWSESMVGGGQVGHGGWWVGWSMVGGDAVGAWWMVGGVGHGGWGGVGA